MRGISLALTVVIAAMLVVVPASAYVDLAGGWGQRFHEDSPERGAGPDIGDYLGLPINDAARLRADSWDAGKWTMLERQCEPHPADYAPRGPASMRLSSAVDPVSQDVTAWHTTMMWMLPQRTIYMDGRPRPSAYAQHTWQGFSTGEWEGDMLKVTTTHLKEGWLRRNGVPRSDRASLVEYFIRHGSYLTLVTVVLDPVYLTEPFVRTSNWVSDPGFQLSPFSCIPTVEIERARDDIPHHLPGANRYLDEFAGKHGVPPQAARGGAETMYPEYRERMGLVDVSDAAQTPAQTRAQAPAGIEVLRAQGNVFLLATAAGNTAVQVGQDGVVVVDTQAAALGTRLLEAIATLSPRPIRHIVLTSGGAQQAGAAAALSTAGRYVRVIDSIDPRGGDVRASIIAHVNVLNAMTAANVPSGSWPTDTYFTGEWSLFSNGEAVQLFHVPAAHSDGDTIVFFRRSDVIVTGAIFDAAGFPRFDPARGGGIAGVIEGLNRVLDIAVPGENQEGGTVVIPGRGRLSDETDVANYRDMVTIVRDRVRDMAARGMSLEQVRRAKPTADYDGLFGGQRDWTSEMFVDAVYRDVSRAR